MTPFPNSVSTVVEITASVVSLLFIGSSSFHMVSGDSTDHQHSPAAVGPQLQTRCSEAAQTTDDIMAAVGSPDCEHPHGSWASSWPEASAWTIYTNLASGSITDRG